MLTANPGTAQILEAHREEVTLHKTAKAAFNESGLKKLPKVKDLNAEYSALLTKKKHSTQSTERHGMRCRKS